MSTSSFLKYITEPDVHDGVILKVQERVDALRVLVKTFDERLYVITFQQVQSVKMHEPEGMLLYSLNEMAADQPTRMFEFTNWEENSSNYLQVIANEIESCEIVKESMF